MTVAFFYADGRVESREQDLRVRHVVLPEQQWADTFDIGAPPVSVTLRPFEAVEFAAGERRWRCFVERGTGDAFHERIATGGTAAWSVGMLAHALGERR